MAGEKGREEMSKTHELKISDWYFSAVATGLKPYEVRKDDRGYQLGDKLRLREICHDTGEYTSREFTTPPIRHMLYGSKQFKWLGIKDGFVVLSWRPGDN